MQRRVYEIFTTEHGVSMTMDALRFIGEEFQDEEEMRLLARKHKEVHGAEIATVSLLRRYAEEIRAARNKGTKIKHEIKALDYREADHAKRYRALRTRIEKVAVEQTSRLAEGTQSHIYGVYYVDPLGAPVIEDEEGALRIRISSDNYLLFPGVCVCLRGTLNGGVFDVDQVIYPKIVSPPATPLPNGEDGIVLFFSGFHLTEENMGKLCKIIEVYTEVSSPPDLIVLMGPLSSGEAQWEAEAAVSALHRKVAGYKQTEFILVPDVMDQTKGFYPKSLSVSGKYKGITCTTNPAVLSIHKTVLLLGRFDLNELVKKESVCAGDNFRRTLARAYLSQSSYNPFLKYGDFFEDRQVSGAVIGDRYDSYVEKVDGVQFVVCGSFAKNEGQFVMYRLSQHEFELCSLNQSQ